MPLLPICAQGKLLFERLPCLMKYQPHMEHLAAACQAEPEQSGMILSKKLKFYQKKFPWNIKKTFGPEQPPRRKHACCTNWMTVLTRVNDICGYPAAIFHVLFSISHWLNYCLLTFSGAAIQSYCTYYTSVSTVWIYSGEWNIQVCLSLFCSRLNYL